MKKIPSITEEEAIMIGKTTLLAEAEALKQSASKLDNNFYKAVDIIIQHGTGKVILTGLGKSGRIAEKIAATLCSTGTRAIFLHATEAMHGDLGIYTPGDPTIIISKSGTTYELIRLIPILKRFDSQIIGILGNINSTIAREVDVFINASVNTEADPLHLAPTSSSIVALAIGDALAGALMTARGFNAEDFARIHPSGQLGRNLDLVVADIIQTPDKVACVKKSDSIRQIVIEMTKFPLGAACILGENNQLEGLITDGDLRRILRSEEDLAHLNAEEMMTSNPVTISSDASLHAAVNLMENRPSQISVLPVVNKKNEFLGLIRIHDIYLGKYQE